jgi:hypothetical protein
MKRMCWKCGAELSAADNFCIHCGEPVRSGQRYAGATTPMPIATQSFSLSGWPQAGQAGPMPASARGGGTRGLGYVTTGVAGPEAESLLGDRSGSSGEPGQRGTKMDDIKAALRGHVLQKMHVDRQDHIALVSFASAARVDCPWTRLQDPSPLLTAIGALSPSGGTCFRGGLELAEALFAALPAAGGMQVLRKVIFFTDGHNNEDDPLPVAERLRQAGVIIQAVGFGRTEKDVDVDILRRIVSVIDGKEQYWFCSNAQELTRTFKALSGKTRIFRT